MQEAATVAWLFEQSLLPFQIKMNKLTQKSQKQLFKSKNTYWVKIKLAASNRN